VEAEATQRQLRPSFQVLCCGGIVGHVGGTGHGRGKRRWDGGESQACRNSAWQGMGPQVRAIGFTAEALRGILPRPGQENARPWNAVRWWWSGASGQ